MKTPHSTYHVMHRFDHLIDDARLLHLLHNRVLLRAYLDTQHLLERVRACCARRATDLVHILEQRTKLYALEIERRRASGLLV